jgi:hypothetical protein
MKIIEDKLEQLDEYFAPKKESEKWLVILGIAGLITYLAYDFLLPYTEDLYKKSEVKRHAIEKNIKENTIYLNGITRNGDRDFYVKKYSRDIEKRKKSIAKIKNKIVFIDKNLNKLSDMLFNQQNWAIFLNSITDKAELHDINLHYIDNKYVDSNGSFGHVLEVGVGCQGDYKNIVKFMNELEQNVLVTDIYGSQVYMDPNASKVNADLNISVWGINR